MKFFNDISTMNFQFLKVLAFRVMFFLAVVGMPKEIFGEVERDRTTPGFKLTNLTALSEVYLKTNPINLIEATGIEYQGEHFDRLMSAVQELKDSTGFDVWDAGFSYISMQTTSGLDDNFQATEARIESDKYLLFCFVLKEGATDQNGEIADFLVNIGGDSIELAQDELLVLQDYIQQVTENFFHNEKDVYKRFDADAVGTLAFLNYFGNGKDIMDVPFENLTPAKGMNQTLVQGPIVGPDYALLEDENFISYAGEPITLPRGTIVKFSRSTTKLPNGEANGMPYQFTLVKNNIERTYVAHYYGPSGDHPGEFSGYKADSININTGKTTKILFEQESQFKEEGEPINVIFGLVNMRYGSCLNTYLEVPFVVKKWGGNPLDKAGKGVYQKNHEIWEKCVKTSVQRKELYFPPVQIPIPGHAPLPPPPPIEIETEINNPFSDEPEYVYSDNIIHIPCQLKSIDIQDLNNAFQNGFLELRPDDQNSGERTVIVKMGGSKALAYHF